MRIRAGNHFQSGRARTLPIIAVVASGLEGSDAERLAGELERAQLAARSFRPLIVIDTPEFGPFRRRGYVVERIMQAEELAAVNPGDDHNEYVESRLKMIVQRYGVSSLRIVEPFEIGSIRAKLSGAPEPLRTPFG